MNEVCIADLITSEFLASEEGNVVLKKLGEAWDSLNWAQQSLRKVLREDDPEDADELIKIMRELEHITYQLGGIKRRAYPLVAAAGMAPAVFQAKVRRIVQKMAMRYGGHASGQIATGVTEDGTEWSATISRHNASNGETFGRLDVSVKKPGSAVQSFGEFWDWEKVFEKAGIPVVNVGTHISSRESSIAEGITRSLMAVNKFEKNDVVLLHKGGRDVETEVLQVHFNGGKYQYTVEAEKEPVPEMMLKRAASVKV